MGFFSNNLIGVINATNFFLSMAILGWGIWLAENGSSVCGKFLQWPVIGIGIFLMILSIAGFTGACFRVTWVMWVYLFFMFLLIILLFCFTIFAFVLTNKGAGEVVPNRGFKEYRMGDYNNWLQKMVNNSHIWKRINNCVKDANICKNLADDRINETAKEFYSQNLSPIESGCCKPPTSCNFTFVNATVWSTVNAFSSANNTNPDCGLWSNNQDRLCYANNTNPDCGLWSNNQDLLCYGCSTCKAGVLATLKRDRMKVGLVSLALFVALVVVFSVACFAWRNIRRDHGYDHRWKHN